MRDQALETEIHLPFRVVDRGRHLHQRLDQLRPPLHGQQAVGHEAEGLFEKGKALIQLRAVIPRQGFET